MEELIIWQFIFPKGCLITNQLQFINVDVSSMKIPQGISYLIENSCVMKVLNTWVLIQELI